MTTINYADVATNESGMTQTTELLALLKIFKILESLFLEKIAFSSDMLKVAFPDLDPTADNPRVFIGSDAIVPGTSNFHSAVVTNGTAITVKGAAAWLFNLCLTNPHDATVFVRLYNKTSATASDTPLKTFAVPANNSVHVSLVRPLYFSTSCSIRSVVGSPENDNTAPTTATIVDIEYK